MTCDAKLRGKWRAKTGGRLPVYPQADDVASRSMSAANTFPGEFRGELSEREPYL